MRGQRVRDAAARRHPLSVRHTRPVDEGFRRGTYRAIELIAEGRVSLQERATASIVELALRFKFSDKFKTKNEITKGLFGEPGSKVPGLFELDPKIRRSKRDDGFYAWKISGPLAKLRFDPRGGKAAAGRPRARGRSRGLRGFDRKKRK